MSVLEDELLWHIRAAGLPSPERELTGIVPGRKFRFDLGWKNARLLVEINGGVFMKKSGHNTGQGINRDTEKCNLATLEGWTVLSVTSNQIHDGRALRWIQRALVNGLQRTTM